MVRYHVRGATLTGYERLVRTLGLDPSPLLTEVGLRATDLATPDRWIPAAPVARLLEVSARESGCEAFAVRLAGFRRFSTLGPICLVLREEPDLRSALDLLIRYRALYNGVLDLALVELDGLVTVRLSLEFGEPAPVAQALDLTAAALIGAIRELVGEGWRPLTACFSHPAPSDAEDHQRLFGPGLRFDHPFTGLVFPSRDLALPVVASDPALRPYTRRFLQTVADASADTLSDQVAELVEVLLPLGRCSLENLSHVLGREPRTLRRHLAGEGTSFSAVVNATRRRLAERLLANERYSLTDVSALLGFAAPSAFTRWFEQQFGTTPTGWRSALRQDA